MKSLFVLFFKIIIIVISIISISGLIYFPQTEGSAQGLNLVNIYSDPLIIYSFLSSIPFYIFLYQLFKLVGYLDNKKKNTQKLLKALNIIKYCSILIPILIFIALVYIIFNANGDDYTGPVVLGFLVSGIFMLFAVFSFFFQKKI